MDNTLSMSFTCRNLYGQVALTICKCSAPVALDSHILFFTITRFAISNSSQLNDICHSISRRTSCTFAARPYRTVNLLLLCWNNYSVPSGHRFCNTVFLSRLRTRRTHTQFGAWGSIGGLVTVGLRIRYSNFPFGPRLGVGIGSGWGHLLMDVVTWGRGVMLCWPVSLTRYATGIPIFFGAHHSHPTAWKLHLITLTTELAYVFVLWRLLRRFWTARSDKFVQEASTR